jgi:hypothetical protein
LAEFGGVLDHILSGMDERDAVALIRDLGALLRERNPLPMDFYSDEGEYN